MATEKGELMHECFPKRLRMGKERMKENTETEESKQERVKLQEVKWAQNCVPDA